MLQVNLFSRLIYVQEFIGKYMNFVFAAEGNRNNTFL